MRLVVNATSCGTPPGGAGLRARHLFRELDPRRFELVFLLAQDTPASIAPPGAAVRRLPVSAARPLERWFTLRLPAEGDLLFTDHYPAGPVPTVITLHDCGHGRLRRHLIHRHLRRAAAVVAVSETVRAAWGVAAHVIPNGVAVPASVDVAPGPHLLLCDPGLAHKGLKVARHTARALGRPLEVVGRGARWLAQPELFLELARAAAVLCPSSREGFGMVPLEAMALGRPVVASDLPAHREVLGPHAYYAPAGDAEAFAAAARRALEATPEKLAAARAHARGHTWRDAAKRLERLITELRARSRHR